MIAPSKVASSLRVCVCTTVEGAAEPRAPRHAAALADMEGVEVVFLDCAPSRSERRSVKALMSKANIDWRTHSFATRTSAPVILAFQRLHQWTKQLSFRIARRPSPVALSIRACGLETALDAAAANVYVAHNIEMLFPAALAARRQGALLMFDAMEFHSDMGAEQSELDRDLVRIIERTWLPECALVLASSDQLADALSAEYGIPRPVPLYNVPPIERTLPPSQRDQFSLYWRNAVVGLGQRGLDEALVALKHLPEDVTLHLQGRTPADNGRALNARIEELRLGPRVVLHPAHAPEDAVQNAAQYTVGLCLERAGIRNHDLTVSNKIFDYHMAGLAVIASDLPGLRSVIERSHGGLLFKPGSSDDLARRVLTLYKNRSLLSQLAGNARQFALREANLEIEMGKFRSAFESALSAHIGKSSR